MLKKITNYYFLIFNFITFFILTAGNYIESDIKYHLLRIPYMLLLLLSVSAFYRFWKDRKNSDNIIKINLYIIIALLLTYMFVFVVRLLRSGFGTAWLTFYPAIVVIFAGFIFLAFKTGIFKYEYLHRDIIVIVFILTINQLFFGFFTYGGIRASKLLENIMVFNSVIISYLPLQLFWIFTNRMEKHCFKNFVVSMCNIILSIVMVIASGSRSAILILFVLVFLMSVINLTSRRNVMLIIGIITLSVTALFTMNASNSFGIKSSIERTSSSIFKPGELKEEASEVSININESNQIRSMLRDKSIAEIKKSPIIGTGNAFFKYKIGKIELEQSSHNIILEIWLIFGMIGLIIYLLLFSVIAKEGIILFINRKDKRLYFTCMLSILSIIGLAMFQPLMIMIIPNITFWTMISNLYNKGLIGEKYE